MDKNFNELFEGDFSNTEKAAVARKVMEIQDRIRSSNIINIVLSAVLCAIYFAMACCMLLNFPEIVDHEMDPKTISVSTRSLKGKAGVAQDVLAIISVPFALLFPVTAVISAEKEMKPYREFRARKITVLSVEENESIKGLYTVAANSGDKAICFDTSDSGAKNYADGDKMIVVDFVAVKERTFENSYDYYTASDEKRRIMAIRKASGKYFIIHT